VHLEASWAAFAACLIGPPGNPGRPALAHRRLDPPGSGSRRRLRPSRRDHADKAQGVAIRQSYLWLLSLAPMACAGDLCTGQGHPPDGYAAVPGRFVAHCPVRGAGRGSPSCQSALHPFCIARSAQNASKRETGDSPVRSRAIGSRPHSASFEPSQRLPLSLNAPSLGL
jgi:hypothetical protein